MATCEGLSVMGSSLGWNDLLVYPVTCFHYFWGVILFGIFVLMTYFLFNSESEKVPSPDLISSMAVSATAVLFLGVIGTLIKSTNGSITMISSDIMIVIIALWIVICAIWFFKG